LKKLVKVLLILLLCAFILAGGIYVGLGYYYRDGFSYGTYINGVYCTGKSVEEVDSQFVHDVENSSFVIKSAGESYEFPLSQIDIHADYTDGLRAYINTQNPYLWVENLYMDESYNTIAPVISWDSDKLSETIDSLSLDRIGAPFIVELKYTDEDGYFVENNKPYQYDVELIKIFVNDAIANGKYELVLTEEMYGVPVYSSNEKALIDISEKIAAFGDKDINYQILDQKVTLSKGQVAGLLKRDEKGLPVLNEEGRVYYDEESVLTGLNEALNPYNTYHNHRFKTHDGRYVYINKGTYGNEIDIEVEAAKLYEALETGQTSYESTVELKHEAKYSGPDDIGPTYLEISLDEQHLYYYVDGKMVLDSDVVTGNHSHRCDTPEGVDYVYYMQRNRTLIGENYQSFVKYWIAFINHIGVHDASWRKDYGGDIYLTNGSHGCVNTPEENVSKLYDMIEVGTPVIVYSYNNSLTS